MILRARSLWLCFAGLADYPQVAIPGVRFKSNRASFYDEYSIGPSIGPICTRLFLTRANMIQVRRDFH